MPTISPPAQTPGSAPAASPSSSPPPSAADKLAHYEAYWAYIRDRVERLAAAGERDVGRILSRITTDHVLERYARNPQRPDVTIEDEMMRNGMLFDARVHVPMLYDFLACTRALWAVQCSTLLSAIEPDVGRIVEPGSGWGRVILGLWAAGGPSKAEYIGCELTAAGRALSERIANIGNVDRFRALPFDYCGADFSSLSEHKPTVVVTNHSIEEVDELPESAIDAIRNIPGFRRCVHLEPVGFQYDDGGAWLPDASEERRREIDAINVSHAQRRNRNRNLVPLLLRKQDAGQIRIERIEKNYLGIIAENATTLIIWSNV